MVRKISFDKPVIKLDREDRLKQKIINMVTVQKQIKKKESYLDPRSFGLYDLLFPRNMKPSEIKKLDNGKYVVLPRERLYKVGVVEDPRAYRKRRYEYLRKFIEENISIEKDGRKIDLKIVDHVLEFIGDVFFGYVRKAILWKSRGGGGSLASALIMWLRMIYHCQSFIDMAGCLLPDTLVMTVEGSYIPVRDVKVGYRVWTLTEGWQKVNKVTKREGEYESVRIRPWRSKNNWFTSDHLIAVVSGLKREMDGVFTPNLDPSKWDRLDIKWKEAKDVDPDIDLVVVGRPENANHRVNKVADDNKNGVWYGEKRVYYSIGGYEKSTYLGMVYDLTVDNEPYFTAHNMCVHNSLDQAKQLYNYTVQFWNCFPDLKKNLLDAAPLISKTALNTGVTLECLTTTEKSARGKHIPGLCLDEVCQDKIDVDNVFLTSMNAAMGQANHTIIALSTFHIPSGLFQTIWDNATEMGFRRYNWSVYDIMEKCEEGLDMKTKKDPYALKFCFKSCPLTRRKVMRNRTDRGFVDTVEYVGCKAKGRTARGFMKRYSMIEAVKINRNSEIYETEWENNRPVIRGSVYDTNDVENSIVEEITYPLQSTYTAVGIDWGFVEGCMCLIRLCPHYLAILETLFMNFQSTASCMDRLNQWEDEYGEFLVFADSSHPFNNSDLDEEGFDITAIDFHMMKSYGITNLTKYFENRRIKSLEMHKKFNGQVRNYKRNMRTGAPLKKDDHAPDCLLAATVELDYEEIFGNLPPFDGDEQGLGIFEKIVFDGEKKKNNKVMLF